MNKWLTEVLLMLLVLAAIFAAAPFVLRWLDFVELPVVR